MDEHRLNERQSGRDFEPEIREAQRKDHAQVQQQVSDAVASIIDYCTPWADVVAQVQPRRAHLFTRHETFGYCFLHNLLLTLLTLRLQESAGLAPYRAGEATFPLLYHGPEPCQCSDHVTCADAVRLGHFKVAGLEGVETILLRHTPVQRTVVPRDKRF